MLEALHNRLHQSSTLSRTIRYQVVLKGSQQRHQKEKLLDYKGPDAHTKVVLLQNSRLWTVNPLKFWTDAIDTTGGSFDPLGRAVWLFVKAAGDDS